MIDRCHEPSTPHPHPYPHPHGPPVLTIQILSAQSLPGTRAGRPTGPRFQCLVSSATSNSAPSLAHRRLYRYKVPTAATMDSVTAMRRRRGKPSPRQADATPLLASDGGGAAERSLGETCEALLASGPWNAAHTTTRAGLVERLKMIEDAGLPRMRVRPPRGGNHGHHHHHHRHYPATRSSVTYARPPPPNSVCRCCPTAS